MLVKKINPDWQPAENRGLQVGETIEITDPKQLIISGMAVGIGEHGEELSTYEMYGVLIDTESEDFEEYLKVKKANAIKAKLEADNIALKAMQEAADKETAKVEAPVVEEPVVAEPVIKTASIAKKASKK
jgi:hypothetical protein